WQLRRHSPLNRGLGAPDRTQHHLYRRPRSFRPRLLTGLTLMKITAIKVYQVDLPLREGRYNWSGGNFMEVFDSTVVAIETDAGITGFAECCPLGSAYLPSYAKGVRAGIDEIAPRLIGWDPTDL